MKLFISSTILYGQLLKIAHCPQYCWALNKYEAHGIMDAEIREKYPGYCKYELVIEQVDETLNKFYMEYKNGNAIHKV